jgi:hypothetical protein
MRSRLEFALCSHGEVNVYFRVIRVGIVIILKYLKVMGARGGWIQPVHDRNQCQTAVNAVMKLGF